MADKTYAHLDAAPNPIPDNYWVTVGEPTGGGSGLEEALKVSFIDFKTQVVPTIASTTTTFYVDGHNSNAGTGTIFDPFQTLDLVIAFVIGSGTNGLPQFQNVAIKVAADNYSTNSNIWLNNVAWVFDEGTIVQYGGTGYFIDSSAFTNGGIFQIEGGLRFATATGGFIQNNGIEANSINKNMVIEIYSAVGTTPLGATSNPTLSIPFINLVQTPTGGGFNPVALQLTVYSNIDSEYQTTIYQSKGLFVLEGSSNNSLLSYGRNGSTGEIGGNVNGAVHHYENNDTTGSRVYLGYFFIRNITVTCTTANTFFSWKGGTNNSYYSNLIINDVANQAPKTNYLLTLDNIVKQLYMGTDEHIQLFLKDILIDTASFLQNDIIKSIGTIPEVDILSLYNCIFPSPYGVDANIKIGLDSYQSNSIVCTNILRGNLNYSNLPLFTNNAAALTGGLKVGDVYKTSTGTLMIVV